MFRQPPFNPAGEVRDDGLLVQALLETHDLLLEPDNLLQHRHLREKLQQLQQIQGA
jgi:hypothetical protein